MTALTLCFLVEFCIRIYFVPSVLELISKKTVIEKAAGIGQEVGHYDLGPLLQCPHYMAVHRSFRKVHMFTAIGNIIAIMCSAFHLYFLAWYGIVKAVWSMELQFRGRPYSVQLPTINLSHSVALKRTRKISLSNMDYINDFHFWYPPSQCTLLIEKVKLLPELIVRATSKWCELF